MAELVALLLMLIGFGGVGATVYYLVIGDTYWLPAVIVAVFCTYGGVALLAWSAQSNDGA